MQCFFSAPLVKNVYQDWESEEKASDSQSF